ncbi:MAG: twin-arginine translocation signal domain-containing protein [Sandaracinaceae bacterium]|nr:twin-arginine translocation signal domain-containing protein [Sandaracinaceae bacterium]
MDDAFTRRGFLGLAAATGVGLCVPSLTAEAQRRLRFSGRLAIDASQERMMIDLYLRHDGPRGIELTGNALGLAAELTMCGNDYPLALRKVGRLTPWLSRAMRPRESTFVVLPPGREALYGRFTAPWPVARTGRDSATLTVRVTRSDARLPEPDQRALRAIEGLHVFARVRV